jgi:hypothetical protein
VLWKVAISELPLARYHDLTWDAQVPATPTDGDGVTGNDGDADAVAGGDSADAGALAAAGA